MNTPGKLALLAASAAAVLAGCGGGSSDGGSGTVAVAMTDAPACGFDAVNVTVTSVNGSDVKFDMVQKIDKTQIAADISAKLTDSAGNKPESVTCPDNLLAKVGAQLNCTMNGKSQSYNVNVTVTSVNGTNVKYDMVETFDKDKVAGVISNKVAPALGATPDSVTCPDNPKGVEGATLRCTVNSAGKTYGATVTVTDVDAGDVSFNIQLDDQPP